MSKLEIRVGSAAIYVTTGEGKKRRDIAQIPRTTGTNRVIDLAELDELPKAPTNDQAETDDTPKFGASSYQIGVVASKNARALAYDNEVDLSAVDGTGKDGKVIVTDVEAYLEERDVAASGVPAADESE